MSKNKLRIISAIIAGLMIVSVMAACGKVEAPPENGSQNGTHEGSQSEEPSETLPLDTDSAHDCTDLPDSPDVPSDTQTDDEPSLPDTEPVQDTNPVQDTDPVQETEPSGSQDDDNEPEKDNSSVAKAIVDTASAQLGVPFKTGGDDPEEGFDSSGFTYYCVKQAGRDFPRSVSSQVESDAGTKVKYSELQAGDIVYFSAEPGGEASFCGVYAGGGLIIYSPVPDDFVKTANITTSYWTSRFVTGLRIE